VARKQIIDNNIRVFTLRLQHCQEGHRPGDLQLRMQGNAFSGRFSQ